MESIIPSDIPLGKYYTYTLSYPESMGGTVFYVGQGKGKRIDQHEWEAKNNNKRNPYKCNVIHAIWANDELTPNDCQFIHVTFEKSAAIRKTAASAGGK